MLKKVVPPIWLLLTIIFMFVLHRYVPLVVLLSSPWNYLGVIPLIGGIAISASSAQLFKQADTGIVPFSETTTIVTGGMFKYTRNPMYVGMVAALIGVALLLGSLIAYVPIPLFMLIIHFVFILNEEKVLEEKFPEEYLTYKNKVRRWI